MDVKDLITEREKMFQRFLNLESLVSGGRVAPQWMADGSSFWYSTGAPDNTVIFKVDPEANSKTSLFDVPRLRNALELLLGHELPYLGLPFDSFEFLDDEAAIKFQVVDQEFICQLDDYQIAALPPLSAAEQSRTTPRCVRKAFFALAPDVMELLSPDGCWFAGEKAHNIWLRATYDGREQQLTNDGVKDYSWDVESAQWSPDSLKLAVKKVDTRDVLRIPIVHWLKPTEEVEWEPYVKTGGPMPRTEIHIVDILSRRQIQVDIGDETDQFIWLVGWRKDGSEFLFYRRDGEWKKLDLMAADPTTGATRIVVSEVQETFVLGLEFGFVQLLTLLEDGQRFIWRSERDGWAHFYLYDFNGTLVSRLTKGSFPVERVVAVDEEGGWVYFSAHAEERLYDTHLYRVDLEGKGFARLTEAAGQHDVCFSPSTKFFLDTHSNLDRPPVVELKRATGELLTMLSEANIDALDDLNWQPPEEFVVKAADGETDLYGVLIKPYDFDPSKKYPVIDCLYNGPFVTWAPRAFIDLKGSGMEGTHPVQQALAHLGFVVLMVDGRGTTQRGKAFNDVVFRNFGRNEIPDHVAALKQVAEERPYIDLDRVGIFGGSWGGYMTLRGMLLAPDFYHVGVAVYPVADLYDHPGPSIESYMGLPHNNREGYEYASNLKIAGNLKGKLLLVHGTSDVNAPFSSTMKMVEALTRAGKPYDLIVLPDLNHTWAGTSGAYMRNMVGRYFMEHLLGIC